MMKNVMMLMVFALTVGFGVNAQTTTDSLTFNKKGYAIAKIKTSAVCDMCKETLEKTMAYEKGVKESDLDVSSKILTVTFDTTKTSLANIRMAIAKVGYDADHVAADEKAYHRLHACCKKDVPH